MFLLISLAFCDLATELHKLDENWKFSVTKSSGSYGEQDDFQARGKIMAFTRKTNNSIVFHVKSGNRLGDPTYWFNITDDNVEMFDANLSLIAVMKASNADNSSLALRGSTIDGKYTIAGIANPRRQSIITLTTLEDDTVYVIRATAPAHMTTGQVITKIIPSFCIIFFMGFGRTYRNRFWRQYRHMNTRTLQNRIHEVQQRNKGKK